MYQRISQIILIFICSTLYASAKPRIYINDFLYKGNEKESWYAAGFKESLEYDLRKLNSVYIASRTMRRHSEDIILEKAMYNSKANIRKDPALISRADFLVDATLFNHGHVLEFQIAIKQKPLYRAVHILHVEGNKRNILDIQNQLISSVVYALKLKYSDVEKDWIRGDHLYYFQPFMLYSRGIEAFNRFRYQQAIDYFSRSLHFYPGYWPLFDMLGFSYLHSGDSKKAIKSYSKAKKILEKNHAQKTSIYQQTLNNLGLAYLRNSQVQQAIAYFQAAIQIHRKLQREQDDDLAYSMKNIAISYAQTKESKKSLAYFHKSKQEKELLGLKKTHAYAEILAQIGLIYHKQQEWQKSLSYLKRAIAIWQNLYLDHIKDYAHALCKKANVLMKLQKYKQSQSDYQQFLQIDRKLKLTEKSEYAFVFFDLAQLQEMNHQPEAAIGNYQKYIQKNTERDFCRLTALLRLGILLQLKPCQSFSFFQQAEYFPRLSQHPDYRPQLIDQVKDQCHAQSEQDSAVINSSQ